MLIGSFLDLLWERYRQACISPQRFKTVPLLKLFLLQPSYMTQSFKGATCDGSYPLQTTSPTLLHGPSQIKPTSSDLQHGVYQHSQGERIHWRAAVLSIFRQIRNNSTEIRLYSYTCCLCLFYCRDQFPHYPFVWRSIFLWAGVSSEKLSVLQYTYIAYTCICNGI